jgi:hypothetical protein
MEFHGESELEVKVDFRLGDRQVLTWDLEEGQLLNIGEILPADTGRWEYDGSKLRFLPGPVVGSGDGTISFRVKFPIRDRDVHTFPLPGAELPINGVSVLLPRGWTSDSAWVEKRLDHSSGRLLLIWGESDRRGEASLLQPGSRALCLATLILWFPYLLAFVSVVGIMGHLLHGIRTSRSGNMVTKEL